MHHKTIYPKLTRPRVGGFTPLQNLQTLMKYSPHYVADYDPTKLRRKNLVAPTDNGTFVKPLKQCFVKNPRLMPMSKIMLTLLVGWAGQGGSLKTTTGIIGKHLSRCRRQVFRYLQDAVEEGYLSYSRTKDKIGRYIGIKIWLNFGAIQHQNKRKSKKTAENIDVTHTSETNDKYILDSTKDKELWNKLSRLASSLGYLNEKITPT